jgi:hypothetical protein
MLDDMAIDLMLWVERKVLLSCSPEAENFCKELRDKRELYQ